jgi:hypothetical protein
VPDEHDRAVRTEPVLLRLPRRAKLPGEEPHALTNRRRPQERDDGRLDARALQDRAERRRGSESAREHA